MLFKAMYSAKESRCARHNNNRICVCADQSVYDGNGHTARAPGSRMQRLKEVLDMRECCIAQLQEKLREQQAQHAQVSCPVLH